MKYYNNIFPTRVYTDISPRGDIFPIEICSPREWGKMGNIFFSPLGKNGE